jgi:hypothetical protein
LIDKAKKDRRIGAIERWCDMTAYEWTSTFMFLALYLVMLFTICFLTFRKGHTVLGIAGILIPFLWLIGAVIPAKPGSSYEKEHRGL